MTTSPRYQGLTADGLDEILELVNEAAKRGGELVAFVADHQGNYVAVMDTMVRVQQMFDEARGSSV